MTLFNKDAGLNAEEIEERYESKKAEYDAEKNPLKKKKLEKELKQLEEQHEEATNPEARAKKKEERFKKTEETHGKLISTTIISAILFAAPLIIGLLFGAMLIGFAIGASLAVLFFLVKQFGRGKWFGIIMKYALLSVIFIVIIYGFWYLAFTPMGKRATATSTIGGYKVGEAVESFTPQINILKQVLTGTYDPSQMYASEQYKNEYEVVKNPGVFLEDVRPLMDEFSCPGGSCDAVIIGRVHAQSISLKGEDKIKVTPLLAQDSQGGVLDCKPQSFSAGTKITQPFRCTKSYAGLSEITPENIKIDLLYTFRAKAGKQIYVADENILQAIYAEGKAPLDFLGISRDDVASWQTKGPAGLGIGLATKEDVIPANKPDTSGDCIGAENVPHYLAFTVQNNGAGDLGITSLKVILPDIAEIRPVPAKLPGGQYTGGDKTELLDNSGVRVRKYALDTLDDTKGQVAPGTFKTYYMTLFVCENFLSGQTHNSFFVFADLDYKYTETASASFTVNPI